MQIREKIRQGFMYMQTSSKKSMTLKEDYYYLVKIDGLQGVAIELSKEVKINESFANVSYFSKDYLIGGKETHLLMLVCNKPELYDDFIFVCVSFLERVLDSEIYLEIQNNPLIWWHSMKELLGNTNIEKATYSIIAELLTYFYLMKRNEDVTWNGSTRASIDLESTSGSYEIKSTLARYGAEITINSQYQLLADYLLYYRFEPSNKGISIQSVVEKLIALGVESSTLEKTLEKLNYPFGSEIRLKSYKILEVKKYIVNESFPKITLESFVDGQLPQHILGLTYRIDLSGVPSEPILLEKFK